MFIALLVIVFAGVVGYFVLNQEPIASPSPTPSPVAPPATVEEPQPRMHTIRYTDSGYAPSSVDVRVGDTVTFINESSDTAWTASNPHPSHTNYTAFDEKEAGAPETSYAFTFTQLGSWRYHNHLNPGHTGTVVVIE